MGKSGGQWWVKSLETSCAPYYYDCPKKLVDQWLKLNGGKFSYELEKDWYESWKLLDNMWKMVQKLESGDLVMVGKNKVKFKFWHKKSRKQFVGADVLGNLYRWTTANITEILPK